jgi:hypothetical protein
MRAILRKQVGKPDVLEIRENPEPEPKAGHAVIQVKAIGINHAEKHMREGNWAEIADCPRPKLRRLPARLERSGVQATTSVSLQNGPSPARRRSARVPLHEKRLQSN